MILLYNHATFFSRKFMCPMRLLAPHQNQIRISLFTPLPEVLLQTRRSTVTGPNLEGEKLQQSISEFQENGVVCMRHLFDEKWIKVAHQGIEKNFSNPSKYCDWLVGQNGKGVYFNDYMNWRKISEFEKFVLHSPAAKIAGFLMQSEVSIFFHEHVFVKMGVRNKAAPWHHDQAYYPINGMQNCTIWMPTTHIPKETCLQFVKGSHQWGKWFHPKKFASHMSYSVDDEFGFEYEDVPNVDEEGYDILSWELESHIYRGYRGAMHPKLKLIHGFVPQKNYQPRALYSKPGDCLAFHMKTLHGTKNSDNEETRYVLATRWLGDDAVYARRPWKTSPPAETLPEDIVLGSKISKSKAFPVIWDAGSDT